jgi:hypothetical protein
MKLNLLFDLSCNWGVFIAAGYGLDASRDKTVLCSTTSRPTLGLTQQPTQWVPGPLSLGVKRPEREADHSPRYSAEIKNGGAILYPYDLMA